MAKNNSEKKLPEANFEVSSLSEVKDENGNGIFHLRTKTKFILAISILILLAAGLFIFLAVENYFAAEIWQLAIWGLCGVLAIYSMFAKSIPTMLLNLILFFGVSLIPVWQAGHETFKPVIEKISDQFQNKETAPVAEPPKVEEKIPPAEEKVIEPEQPQEKISEPETKLTEENKPVENSEPEKILEPEKNHSDNLDLPRI